MSDQNKVAAALVELLQRKRRKDASGDRLTPDRPIMSRPPDAPASGWEKAAALIGAVLAPGSTIASMVLGRPQEESLFDRQIIGPDGKAYYPEVTEGAVPRMKKVQRQAQQTLSKYPTKPDYLRNAGSDQYSEAAKVLGHQVPRSTPLAPLNMSGTAYTRTGPEMNVSEYKHGQPIGTLRFDEKGKVSHAGVLPYEQGKGIGKDLYKKSAMLGRDIYELNSTSQAAASARYAALKELAQGKFPDKPQKLETKKKAMGAPQVQSSAEVRPPTDWNRLSYLTELQKLRRAYDEGEITPAGYNRARQILDSGEYRDVSKAVRERAASESSNMNARILDILDFFPK